ncbi:hypothetical protein B0H15DRAFT_298055 [Mycena belliarum]|uniref:Uncharacterized protein n=1 Tax=Mycena belliarum TaxID=1033014 RepID=A0AAD6XU40_9AGAR|nr:hypothetical protein B0H15DRAFT_298055 [Mycena belliae]
MRFSYILALAALDHHRHCCSDQSDIHEGWYSQYLECSPRTAQVRCFSVCGAVHLQPRARLYLPRPASHVLLNPAPLKLPAHRRLLRLLNSRPASITQGFNAQSAPAPCANSKRAPRCLSRTWEPTPTARVYLSRRLPKRESTVSRGVRKMLRSLAFGREEPSFVNLVRS